MVISPLPQSFKNQRLHKQAVINGTKLWIWSIDNVHLTKILAVGCAIFHLFINFLMYLMTIVWSTINFLMNNNIRLLFAAANRQYGPCHENATLGLGYMVYYQLQTKSPVKNFQICIQKRLKSWQNMHPEWNIWVSVMLPLQCDKDAEFWNFRRFLLGASHKVIPDFVLFCQLLNIAVINIYY